MFEQIHALTEFYGQALTGYQARMQALTTNLANADTPGYKRLEVSFEDQLQRKRGALQPVPDDFPMMPVARHERHLPFEELPSWQQDQLFKPVMAIDQSTTMKQDGNNIDLDWEMARLAQTEISYNAVAQILSSKIAGLKYVIGEGGG